MNRFLAISILSLLASLPVNAQDKIDCRHEGLLGPVKTVEAGRTEYPLVDGKRLRADIWLRSKPGTMNDATGLR